MNTARLLPALLSLVLATSASAQSKTYTNGEDNAATVDTTGDITLTVANTDSATQSGLVSGTGSLTKTGDGTLALSNQNTYSGGTTINGGTLQLLNHPRNLGANPGSAFPTFLTLNGGTLAMGHTFSSIVQLDSNQGVVLGSSGGTLDIGGTSTVQIHGIIAGSGSLTKTGTGTLNLSAHNTYSGGTVINAGTLNVYTEGNIFDTGSITVNAGAKLTGTDILLSSTLSVTGTGARLEVPGATYIGYEGGTGTLNIAAGGTGTASTLTFGYDGGTGTLNLNDGGTLELSAASPFSVDGTANINFAGGTLRPTGNFSTAVNATLVADTTSVIDSNGFNATWSGVLSGGGALTKAGLGTLTLSGANTYTGDTTIDAGTLLLGHVNALQGSTLTTATGLSFGSLTAANFGGLSGSQNLSLTNALTAAVDLNVGANNADTTYSGILLGTGSLTKSGTGTLTLSGANTYSGGTTVFTGTLTGDTSSLQGAFTNHSAVVFNQASTGTYAGSMAGTGSLTKSGAGNLTLSGTNTYAGGTTVSAGTLTGNTTSLQGAITSNTAVVFDQASTGTYAGVLSGTGSLTKSGAGSLTLSGTNTYEGGTTVSAGTLVVSSDANLGASSGALAVTSGATFNAGTNFQTNRAVTLDGSGTQLTTNNGEFVIGSAGTGSLALTNDASASTYNLTLGLNSGTGTVGLSSGGVITVNNSTSLSATSTLNLNTGGTLTTAGLSGSGTFNLAGGTLRSNGAYSSSLASTLSNSSTVDTNGYTTTLSGNLSGSGSLTKSGAGSLTLSGTNIYEGGTTVSAGTLVVSSDAKLGASSGALAVTSGATLNTGGDFRTNRAVTVDGSGTSLFNNGELIIGNAGTGSLALTNNAAASAYNLTLAYTGGTGSLDISSGSTVTVGNVTALDSASSTLNLNTGGTLTTFGLSGSGTFNFAGGSLRSNGALTSSLPATLSNASTVDTNGYATTLSGVLSGSGSLTKSGTGTLTLSGTNTYEGGTTVSAGTLSGSTTSLQGNIANNAAVVFDQASAGTYAGVISGSGSLAKTGADTLTLSQDNTYAGVTTISAGTLQLGTGGSTGSLVGNVANSGTLIFNRSLSQTYNGVVSGTGSVVSDGGVVAFSAAQTYTGATTIKSGAYIVLATTVDQGLAASTTVDLESGGTLDISNRATTVAGLTGAGNVYSFGGSSGHLTVNTADGQNQVFSGTLGSSYANFALTKTGAGTLSLTGSNTYTGATIISAGTLHLGESLPLPSSSITVASGATFRLDADSGFTLGSGQTLGGAGTVSNGLLTVGSGATLAPGSSPGTLTFTDGLTFAGGGSFQFEINDATGAAGTAYDLLAISGTLAITATSGTPFTIDVTSLTLANIAGHAANFDSSADYAFTFVTTTGGITGFAADKFTLSTTAFTNPFSGTWSLAQNGNNLTLNYAGVSAIPEPSTYAVIAGACVFALAAWRKRRRAAPTCQP